MSSPHKGVYVGSSPTGWPEKIMKAPFGTIFIPTAWTQFELRLLAQIEDKERKDMIKKLLQAGGIVQGEPAKINSAGMI